MALKILKIYDDSPIKHMVNMGDSILKIDGVDITADNKDMLVKMKNIGEIRRLLIGRSCGREDNLICAGFGTKRDEWIGLGITTKQHIWIGNRLMQKKFSEDIKRIQKDSKNRKIMIEKMSPKQQRTWLDWIPFIGAAGLATLLLIVWGIFA